MQRGVILAAAIVEVAQDPEISLALAPRLCDLAEEAIVADADQVVTRLRDLAADPNVLPRIAARLCEIKPDTARYG